MVPVLGFVKGHAMPGFPSKVFVLVLRVICSLLHVDLFIFSTSKHFSPKRMGFGKGKDMANLQREGVAVNEKLYVAVGKDPLENTSILTWAMSNSKGKTMYTIHVREPAKKVSSSKKKSKSSFDWFRGGDANQGDDVHNEYPIAKISSPFSFQSLLEQETHLKTLGIESLYIEDEYIENGILKLIKQHGIRELVMGAAADEHCLSWTIRNKKVKSGKAVHVRDNAPPFCHIWFICNGQLVHIREGDNPPVSSPGKDVTVSSERDGGAGSPAASCDLLTSCFNTNNIDPQEFASVCQSLPSSVFPLQNESVCSKHDHIHDQLEHAIKEAENYCRDAFEKSMRLLKAEKEALRDTICKAETADRLYHEEVGRRKEIEETLAIVKDALAAVKVERESTSNLWRKDLDELRETKFQKSALESLVEKSNISLKELQEKFLSEMKLSGKYKNENKELQMERNNALKEAEKLRKQLEQVLASSHVSDCISAFSYSDLEKATKFFHPSLKIGEGGYGNIYKGFLRHTEVAIKILNPNSSQGPREFDQEVDVLLKLRHPNVVTLVGACQESCALVYEYLPGGSLEDRLNCKNNAPPLPWQTRIRIATELCSALLFLHSNRSGCIIHGDLKPANVLLDGNSVCKLGDFGICRMVSSGKTSVNETTFIFTTQPKGTLPYLDPEFLSTGELTPKSDVYSFGIILLRLLTGKSALGIARDVGYALRKGTLGSMLDPSAGDWPFLRAEQLARIALGCCELNRKDRPDLGSDVWRILEPMNSSCQNLSILRLPCENQIPNYFICPIFQELMKDPHMASDGFTYEREAIRGWLDSGHDTSPMTNATLENQNLIPNHALRSSIQEWLQHNLSE